MGQTNNTVAEAKDLNYVKGEVQQYETAKPGQFNYIFVEGTEDESVIGRFKSSNTIVTSPGGKGYLKDVIDFVKDIVSGYLVIRDVDYDCLDTKYFYYDFCSLEIMILYCENSIKAYADALSIDEDTFVKIRDESIVKLSPISRYRKSLKGRVEVDCLEYLENNFEICLLPEKDFLEVFVKNLCAIYYSRGEKEKYERDIKTIFENNDYCVDELKSITNGHDFMEIFFVNLLVQKDKKDYKGKLGTNILKYTNQFSNCIRTLYSYEDFKATDLYRKTRTLKDKNNNGFYK